MHGTERGAGEARWRTNDHLVECRRIHGGTLSASVSSSMQISREISVARLRRRRLRVCLLAVLRAGNSGRLRPREQEDGDGSEYRGVALLGDRTTARGRLISFTVALLRAIGRVFQ